MKISSPIRIAGQGVWIPKNRVDLQSLLKNQKITQEDFEEYAYTTLFHGGMGETRSETVFEAANQALKDAGIMASELDLTVFASLTGADRASWSQAADLNRRLEQPLTAFIDVYQGCCGIMAASEVAIMRLLTDSDAKAALVAGVDLFTESEKWNADFQTFYGDGAGAWIFVKEKGPFQVLSLACGYDADLNDFIYKDDSKFSLKGSKEKFLESKGIEYIYEHFNRAAEKTFSTCLNDAGISKNQLDYFVVPNLSKSLLEKMMKVYDFPLSKTSWEIGRGIGHLAGVDPIMNLYLAKKQGKIKSGDHVFIVTHGAGISVMSMIVRV